MNSLKVAITLLLIAQASSTPPPGYVSKPDNDKDPPKYEFGYNINDGQGGSQGHIESRDGIYALGKYYVNLPGGSDQKVDYFADDWGYHPLVEYKSSSHSGSSSTQFAFGEKAVAALSKANPAVSNLDFTKPKTSLRLQPKPLVSIKSTLGIVSDPSQPNVKVLSTTPPPSLAVDQPVSGPALIHQPVPVGQHDNLESTQTSPEKYSLSAAPSYDNFESQRYTANVQPEVVSSNFVDNPTTKYTYTPSPILSNYNSAITNSGAEQNLHESTTYKPQVNGVSSSNAGVQIVSYLADTNSAIDVTGKGYDAKQADAGHSQVPHTISAIFVAENDHKLEENEVSSKGNFQEQIISTTSSPKTLFKPIVVPDATAKPVFSTTEKPYETSSIVYKDSKFYKATFYPDTSDVQQGSYKPVHDVDDSSHRVEISTVTPTPEPVLVTPKPAKLFTSSDSILAPIQAAVTLSHTDSDEECNDFVSDVNAKIEQANIQEKAVYTTTIDVQKSIPYEIVNREQEEQSIINNQNNLSYRNNYHIQGPADVAQQTSNEIKYSPENFLQQVIQSYHKLSNGNSGYYQENERNININANNIVPVQPQQYYIPNRLYYIYLQRYNPYINRYAEHLGNQYHNGQSATISHSDQYVQTQLGVDNVANVNTNPHEHQIYAQSYSAQTEPDFTNPNSGYAYVNQVNTGLTENGQTIVGHSGINSIYKNADGNNFENSKQEQQVPSSEFEKSIAKSQTSFVQSQRQPEGIYNGSPLQVLKTVEVQSNSYQKNEDLANNLASLYATQLNALRNLESDKNNEYDKDKIDLKFVDNPNNGEVIKGNAEISTDIDQANVYSNSNTNLEHSTALQAQNGEHQFVEQKQGINLNVPGITSQAVLTGQSEYVPVPEVRTEIIEKPVPVEVTKVVEKPVPVPHPVPVERTKVIHVEKPVAVPVPVTKLVAVDRPVAVPEPYPVPHPVPLPYEVPHPVGVPVPHFIPYPHVVPVPYKEYHPIYIYAKKERLEHLRHYNGKQSGYQKPFTPSQEVFTSQYPPRTYQVSRYMKGPHGRGHGKKLCIEYGGFKPPLVPSVQIDEDKSDGYGSSSKHR